MEDLKQINWEEFDRRKDIEGGDKRYFSFQDWEIDFMVREIVQNEPHYNEIKVLRALLQCCETIPAPYPKNDFYLCVLKRLHEN